MKEIIAIIRMNKVNRTKTALADMGICGLHAMKVQGRGKNPVDFTVLAQLGANEEIGSAIQDSIARGARLIPKRLLTVMAHDEQVPRIIQTIVDVNQEGHRGDGKIFVLPVTDVVRIRTGESGEEAI